MMTSTDKQETMHANRKRHYPAESAPMDQLFSRGQSRVYKRGIQRRLSIVEPCRFSLSRFSTQGRFISAHEQAHLHTVAQLLNP